MAITNAQQYRQLRRQGGIMGSNGGSMLVTPTRDGSRPGYSDTGPGGNPGDVGAGHTGDSIGSNDGDNRDKGKEISLAEARAIADAKAAAALGDPDPFVDMPLGKRDTITSYVDNLRAAFRSNPLMGLTTPTRVFTALDVARKTGKARDMLGLQNPGPPDDDDDDNGDNQQIMYPQMMMAQAPSIMEQPKTKEEEELEGLRLAFRAEGGSINDQIRQAYGLGSIVKKATRAVKKIAKSDIGKAALLYGATAGLGSLGAGGGFGSLFKLGTYAPGAVKANLGTAFTRFLGGKLTPNLLADEVALTGQQNLLQRAIGSFPGGVTGAITAVSLLPLLGIGTGDESEEEAQAILKQSGIDIDAVRADPNKFLARRFKAEGGSMKEPVAKKTMPLLDMGGQEMDLRAEGGFVPIGRMEKADDVPARLSKNEFVFPAEAVSNAGEGNVDKGEEVMYNMMKNLEAGGDVSEESQGLEGARRMFQTSQRLEEVL